MEKLREKELLIVEKFDNLSEVSREIFEERDFGRGDVVIADNDETLVSSLENFILRKPFNVLPEDSKEFLASCKEKGVPLAIVTNMPREDHYMNKTIPVFGYDHFFENKILRNLEFPLSLSLGSLYKQTEKSLLEIAHWSLSNMDESGRIAWVCNSYLDYGFGLRLNRVLRDFGFKGEFYMYRLPVIRSFRKK